MIVPVRTTTIVPTMAVARVRRKARVRSDALGSAGLDASSAADADAAPPEARRTAGRPSTPFLAALLTLRRGG